MGLSALPRLAAVYTSAQGSMAPNECHASSMRSLHNNPNRVALPLLLLLLLLGSHVYAAALIT